MTQLTKPLSPPRRVYQEIGQRLAGHMECDKCLTTLPAPAEDVAEYIRDGWPKCCGNTMRLVPHPEETE